MGDEKYTVSATLLSPEWIFQFVMRIPNPLDLEDIEKCPYFKDFMDFDGCVSDSNALAKMKYLRGVVDDYVRQYDLYCDEYYTEPMMYILII